MTNTIFIDRVTNFFNEFKAIANNLFQASEELKNRTENLNTPVLNQKKNDSITVNEFFDNLEQKVTDLEKEFQALRQLVNKKELELQSQLIVDMETLQQQIEYSLTELEQHFAISHNVSRQEQESCQSLNNKTPTKNITRDSPDPKTPTLEDFNISQTTLAFISSEKEIQSTLQNTTSLPKNVDITSDVSVENKTRENYSNIDQESAQKNEITKQTTVCTVSTHHRHQMNSHCDCLNDQLTPQIAQNSHSSDPVLLKRVEDKELQYLRPVVQGKVTTKELNEAVEKLNRSLSDKQISTQNTDRVTISKPELHQILQAGDKIQILLLALIDVKRLKPLSINGNTVYSILNCIDNQKK